MRHVSAIGLTLALFGHHGFAAAADDPVLKASIARSASREASRLAVERFGTAKDAGWQTLRKLDPARPLVITTAAATVTRTFVAADDRTLTVLNLNMPALSEASKRQLLDLTRASPLALVDAAGGSPKLFEAFRFGPDGVFLRGQKVAELGEIVERVPIGDVLTIGAALTLG
jgi:DNA-binding NarL/FixJ family response regulator